MPTTRIPPRDRDAQGSERAVALSEFGRSSEKIDCIIEQLELMLDELETGAAVGCLLLRGD